MREIRVLLWYAWRRKLVFVLANANFLWYDYTTLQPVSPVSKGRSADKFHDKKIENSQMDRQDCRNQCVCIKCSFFHCICNSFLV